MRNKIIKAVTENRIIVIVRGVEEKSLIPFAEAMLKGGIKMLEITFTAGKPEEDIKTAERIKLLADRFGEEMYIGAGTVLTERQIELVWEAGGKFIISPDVNPSVIKRTVELGLTSMPGALTPTEIQTAHLCGADFVKLFPVSALGAEYVKAVKAPLSHISLLAVGGIHDGNMKEYAASGVVGFGVGSSLTDKKLIAEGRFHELSEIAKRYTSAAKEAFS